MATLPLASPAQVGLMKLKCQPEDFRVEELPAVANDPRGDFVLYRLTKSGIGTIEAVDAIRRRWNLAPGQVQYGGLKDRHALTIQYLTIARGPDHSMSQPSFDLEPVGRLRRPYGPQCFRGNRFDLVLRDLDAPTAERLSIEALMLEREGVPNYFDDQRFGSVSIDNQFIARSWLLGDHDRALWLALAAPNTHDRPDDRRIKETLREHWGDWVTCKAQLERSHARSIVTYLVDHPTDQRRAFARLKRELRTLYFSAYQSHLWNRILARMIQSITRPDQRVDIDFRLGPMPLVHGLDNDQAQKLGAMRIPLPSSRNAKPEGELGAAVDSVLADEGLEWANLRVRHLDDVFLSKGDRTAMLRPQDVTVETGRDELYSGRTRLSIGFVLDRGAYATMLVKRLTEVE